MISSKVSAVLRRRWPVLVVSLVVGVLAGVVSSQLAPSDIVQQFRAEQVVVANAPGTGGVSVEQDSLKVTRGRSRRLLLRRWVTVSGPMSWRTRCW